MSTLSAGSSPPIHPITRLYSHCSHCGLPSLTCICQQLTPIVTQARFLLLTSSKETVRASNTGRLLQLINSQATEIVSWERKQPSARLLEALGRDRNAYLVFPAEADTAPAERATQAVGPNPLFILIDGTWQEARKIVRKSSYLDGLPRLALPENVRSAYSLREGQSAGALCTIEAAMECLKLAGERAGAQAISEAFTLFLQHYQAGLSGHRVKICPAADDEHQTV